MKTNNDELRAKNNRFNGRNAIIFVPGDSENPVELNELEQLHGLVVGEVERLDADSNTVRINSSGLQTGGGHWEPLDTSLMIVDRDEVGWWVSKIWENIINCLLPATLSPILDIYFLMWVKRIKMISCNGQPCCHSSKKFSSTKL